MTNRHQFSASDRILCERCFAVAALLAFLAIIQPSVRAQQEPSSDGNAPAPSANTQLITVHGVVRNSITNDPLSRVLVRFAGELGLAALTDSDGRFEIPGVAPGPQVLELRRPGFHDAPTSPSMPEVLIADSRNSTHSILVTPGMADLSFAMEPFNVIHGHVELSAGEPGAGIRLSLLQKGVDDGRTVWRHIGGARTNSKGAFRFSNLDDGTYLLYTLSSMDSDTPVVLMQPGRDDQTARNGYAMMFYPDARDPSGAAQIQVRHGDEAQANFHLTLEPFHIVRAEVIAPSLPPGSGSAVGFSAAVTDSQGHQLSYDAINDAASHSIQALVPDGVYGLRISQIEARPFDSFSRAETARSREVSGQAYFTMAGKSLRLRVPLSPLGSSPVQVNLTRTAAPPSGPSDGIHIVASRTTAALADGMMTQLAAGNVPGILQTSPLSPGQYWIYSFIQQPGLCESSFTAGGANLAREPLIVGAAGATAPLNLTLRDDCATLKLTLPANLPLSQSGEEPAITVYAVPDFDSTAPVIPRILRPSGGGYALLTGLTPGPYHIYAFKDSVNLEYRNRELLSKLPSQAITLEPSSTSNLIVEVPAP